MTQGERVRKIRKIFELTLEEFGKHLGVTKVAISNIERGQRNLTDRMLNDICREFKVNESWLRTGEGGDDNIFTKSNENNRFAINLNKLSQTENEIARNILNAIAEAEPEKLKIIEDFMKTCLGLK